MIRKAKEKIIEYGPKEKSKEKTILIFTAAATVLTWVVMISGAIYLFNNMGTDHTEDFAEVAEQIKATQDEISSLKEIEKEDFIPPTKNFAEEKVKEKEDKEPEFSTYSDSLTPLVLSLIELQNSVNKKYPYLDELEKTKQLAQDYFLISQKISQLESLLSEGIKTPTAIEEEFDHLASAIVRKDREKSYQGLSGKLLKILSNYISIRKVGEDVEGNDTEAIVARTEAALKNGNIKTAIIEIEKLEANEFDLVKDWQKHTEKIIEVENIFADIYQRIAILSGIEEDLPDNINIERNII